MLQAKVIEPGRVVIEEVDQPGLQDHQVIVEVYYCGICGSDIHVFHGKHPFVTYPVVQGHEFSGIISEVGKDIGQFNVGQKVTALPSLFCGECFSCRTGRYNICDNLRVMGFQAPGAMAQSFALPQEKVLPLPDDMELELGALVEPTAVGVHALKQGGLKGTQRILIIGAGPIGLLLSQVARAMGAREVIIIDIEEKRLKTAKEIGADLVLNPQDDNFIKNIEDERKKGRIDLIFECVGATESIRQAVEFAEKGSRIVVVGVFGEDPPVQMGFVQDRELELVGTLMYRKDDFKDAIDMIKRGKVNPGPLITKRFPLNEIGEAYRFIEAHKAETLKVIIEIGGKKNIKDQNEGGLLG